MNKGTSASVMGEMDDYGYWLFGRRNYDQLAIFLIRDPSIAQEWPESEYDEVVGLGVD